MQLVLISKLALFFRDYPELLTPHTLSPSANLTTHATSNTFYRLFFHTARPRTSRILFWFWLFYRNSGPLCCGGLGFSTIVTVLNVSYG